MGGEGGSHRRNDSGSLIQPIAADRDGYDGGDGMHEATAAAFLDDEEKVNEEARRKEEEKKRLNESPYKEFYRDAATGSYYDVIVRTCGCITVKLLVGALIEALLLFLFASCLLVHLLLIVQEGSSCRLMHSIAAIIAVSISCDWLDQ